VNWLWLKNRMWAAKHRCMDERRSSAFLRTAGAAQAYLHELYLWYEPCKVCGSLTCRWAVKRETVRVLTEEQQARYEWMMEELSRLENRRGIP
jgi:hypothetical protein